MACAFIGMGKGDSSRGLELFVRNLHPAVTSGELRRLFQVFGSVAKALVVWNRERNVSKEFGFVQFSHPRDALVALVAMNGELVRGQPIYLSVSYPKSSSRKHIKETLFDNIPLEKAMAMLIDDVAVYSVTPLSFGDKTSQLMVRFCDGQRNQTTSFPSGYSIIDGTSCVGGNTLSFSSHFDKVVAVEFDKSRFEMLQHNVEQVLERTNIQCMNADFSTLLEDPFLWENIDCLYLDPPWGGPDYKVHRLLQLSLGELTMPEICIQVGTTKKHVSLIALKLPNNFDFDSLVQEPLQELFPNVLWCRYSRANLSIVFLDSKLSAAEFEECYQHFDFDPQEGCLLQAYRSKRWEKCTPACYESLLRQRTER